MLKKCITLLLAALMVASLAACGVSTDRASGSAESADTDMRLLEPGKLIIATEATFPPYEMPAEDGQGAAGTGFAGIDIDLAAAIADKLGLELVVKNMTFDSALYAAQLGKSDLVLAGIGESSERKQFMLFSEPYISSVQVVIVPDTIDPDEPYDYRGKKIGTQKNTTSWIYSMDDFGEDQVTVFDTGAQAVQALLDGRLDAVVLEQAPAENIVRKTDGVVILDQKFTEDDYVIGMAKDNPGLQQAVNQALKELDDDGTLRRIIERYIPSGEQ